jgi:predicted dehydrogenase
MKRIRTLLVGYGYWGPNLARNIVLNPNFELIGVIDQSSSRRDLARNSLKVETYARHQDVADLLEIDLVVICTRPGTHLEIGTYFISRRVNVLITKPCGLSSTEASYLNELAIKYQVKALCDFTYHFSPLIAFLLEDRRANRVIQSMREYTSYRTSLGIVQSDVDVIADLGVHDIYVLLLLKSALPKTVSGFKTNSVHHDRTHSAVLVLTWSDGFRATIHVSWNSPKKVRLISIASEFEGIILEEMNMESPVQLISFEPIGNNYETLPPIDKHSQNVSFSMGKVEIPKILMHESLALEIELVGMSLNKLEIEQNLPTLANAAEVWKVVEALQNSIALGGVQQNVE